MYCPKCGTQNVSIQMVTENQLKTKHHSFLYWLIIGWWLHLLLWFFLTIPMILLKLFGGKKQKIVTQHRCVKICQNCGFIWE